MELYEERQSVNFSDWLYEEYNVQRFCPKSWFNTRVNSLGVENDTVMLLSNGDEYLELYPKDLYGFYLKWMIEPKIEE